MKKIDFLFRYEHKVREIESLMLIRLELERRGYSVDFIGNYEYNRNEDLHPRVFIAPAVYDNRQLKSDWLKYGILKKVANMQWEQLIGVKEEEDINGYHNPKEIGQRIVNFCWGENSHNRIIRGGVRQDRAPIVGHINTDLLRLDFRKTLYPKRLLAQKYNLVESMKWYLFVSSFAYCEMDEYQKKLCIAARGADDFYRHEEVSLKSRETILNWIELVLKKDPNIQFIYRPHPDETARCVRLKDMSNKYPNFRVIGQEAMKHWVNACDKIYNWYSTGIVDAITLEKPYRQLRPYNIHVENDYRMMHCARSIKKEEEFLEDLYDTKCQEIIPKDLFGSYYFFPKDYVYLKICDILEEMLKTNIYDVDYTLLEKVSIRYIHYKYTLLKPIKRMMLKLPPSYYPSFIKYRINKRNSYQEMLKNGYEKNVAKEEELKALSEKLRPIVYGE